MAPVCPLWESDRQVSGLVFGLAVYLINEVPEEVPLMVFNPLGAFDVVRTSQLVDYFDEYADYLIVTLLEENARTVACLHPRYVLALTPIISYILTNYMTNLLCHLNFWNLNIWIHR